MTKELDTNTVLLIDGDIVVYQIGFSCQRTVLSLLHKETNEFVARFKSKTSFNNWGTHAFGGELDLNYDDYEVKEFVEPSKTPPVNKLLELYRGIWDEIFPDQPFDSDRMLTFFTHSNNFRDIVVDDYKAGRNQQKPYYYKEIKDLIKKLFPSEEREGLEADDLLSIRGYNQNSNHM